MPETNSTTEQSSIEKAESVANIVQAVINSVAGYYGGNTGKAFANALTGNGAVLTSIGDLVDKFNNGTATSKDVGDVLQDLASIIAGVGFIAGRVNPWVFGVLAVVGLVKGVNDYVDANPELKKEILDLVDNFSAEEFIDIWDYFDQKYTITDSLNDLWTDWNGGDGDDIYIADSSDTILDPDGKGVVSFEGSLLTGGELIDGSENQYAGDGGVYTLNEGTLIFTKGSGETLTINNYLKDNSDLRIRLNSKYGCLHF